MKIAELHSVIRKLEDRNALLADERNELVRNTHAEVYTCNDYRHARHKYSYARENMYTHIHAYERCV